MLINDQERDYVVRGFVPESAQVNGNVVLMDIAAAQRATGKAGRVDRILLKVPDQPSFNFWQQKLRAVLPSGVELNPQGSQTAANRRMLSAFRWNLRILSYVALRVGAFLIYNTISVSVVRRRVDIGTVRALGASRRAVLMAFLAEAAIFGFAGTVIALPLGRLMATGAVRLLATTVDALYISSRPGSLSLSIESVIRALVVGVGVAVASLVLIFVINKQSFGWTIQFHWPVSVLVGALSIVYGAPVLVGIYPARIAQRLNPIEVVHEE